MIQRNWNDNNSVFSFCRIIPRVCLLVLFQSPKILYRWRQNRTHQGKWGIFNTICESTSLVFTINLILRLVNYKIASDHSIKLVIKITTNYLFYTKSKGNITKVRILFSSQIPRFLLPLKNGRCLLFFKVSQKWIHHFCSFVEPKLGVQLLFLTKKDHTSLAGLPGWFYPWLQYLRANVKPPLKNAVFEKMGLLIKPPTIGAGLAFRH